MEHDIYHINLDQEAKLTHAVVLLEDVLEDLSLAEKEDPRVQEVYDILLSLPFLGKNF